MRTFQEHLAEMMEDPEFAKRWEERRPMRKIRVEVMRARAEKDLTQAELAELAGTKQSNISRLERGNDNVTVDLLRRVAEALDKKLEIKFI